MGDCIHPYSRPGYSLVSVYTQDDTPSGPGEGYFPGPLILQILARQFMTKPVHPSKTRRRRWSVHAVRRHLSRYSDCNSPRRNLLERAVCYFRRLYTAYGTHQCSLLACACSYCALLSLIPLLVVGIAALGFFLGSSEKALDRVSIAINGYVPVDLTFVKIVLTRILQDRGLIGLLGLTGLLYAAHQTFLAMQPAMNIIWGVAETRHWVKQRLIALAATFYTIILLGADLYFSALFVQLQTFPVPRIAGQVVSAALNIGLGLMPMLLTTLLFALLYQYIPARTIPWKAAFLGAGIAALLWQLTKVGFAMYLSYIHSYDRLYGPLGGLVILVVWTYYSIAILLLGAEIAADYAFQKVGLRAAEARAHSGADLAAASIGVTKEE